MGVWSQGGTSAVVDSENQSQVNLEDLELQEIELLHDLDDLKMSRVSSRVSPLATPVNSWDSLKDSVSLIEDLIGFDIALKNHISKYNRLIDTVADMASQWNRDISQIEIAVTGINDVLRDNNTKVGTVITRSKSNAYDIDVIEEWKFSAQNTIDTHGASITANRKNIRTLLDWKPEIQETVDAIETRSISNMVRISIIEGWKSKIQDTVDANTTRSINNMVRISKIEKWKPEIQETVDANTTRSINNMVRISKIEKWKPEIQETVDAIETRSISNMVRISIIEGWKSKIQDTVDANETRSINNVSRITALENNTTTGEILDLAVLVTAINAVGSKVQDLIDVFDVTDPQPDSFAFFFQSLIKSQTLAIVDALAMVDESLNDNFVNYFSDSKNGQFWTAYKEFSDFQMAVFFGVFFESLQEDWESNWLTVLDVWNTTNSFLATIAGWLDQIQLGVADSKEILAIITNWLKLIYEKPIASVNVPSFDFDRLERILKKLEFGEVVNEAGTNIWDFLTGLVDTLGDLIETQLKEFTNVLSEILDFLDGLIDKMIGLIVPKNLDFMRQGFDDVNLKFKAKFGNFLNISASITQMFRPIEKDFISELSFDFMGVPFVPDITILATFVPKFRNVVALLMWFNVGWWAFRRFTGTGDVVNDN